MFETKAAFSLNIENIVYEHECSYTDALLYFSETTGADYKDMAEMMSDCLKEKVKQEAISNFHIKQDTETTVSIDDNFELDSEM